MNRFYESAEIAKYYVKYRQNYTPEVAQRVMTFYNNQQQSQTHLPTKLDLMVDVGCGSGQSTNIFQPYFKKILGFDVSAEQIKQAKLQNKFDNIDYMEGSAENIAVKDKSVDLIVAGAAAHWFDLEKFFDEVRRVLKPTGCLVILFYANPILSLMSASGGNQSEKASDIFRRAIDDYAEDPLQKYVHQNLVKNSFANIYDRIPFDQKKKDDSLHTYIEWSVNDACGLIKSVQTYALYMDKEIKKMKDDNIYITQELLSTIDPALLMAKQLQELWNLSDEQLDEKLIWCDFKNVLFLTKPSK